MWTILEDTNDKYVAYNYLHDQSEAAAHKMALVDLNWADKTEEGWQPAGLRYNRAQAQGNEDAPQRQLNIVFSDYYTHLVAESCVELEGGKH